jgi:hypothetical protein
MDNSENRLNNVFFYGLYMDPDILKTKGVEPRNPRKAIVKGYRLRIGKMATLLRDPNAETHGIVYELTHGEVDKLYWGAGLNAYVAEALVVETERPKQVVALCCNLLVPPAEDETNPEYMDKLVQCMSKLDVHVPGVLTA